MSIADGSPKRHRRVALLVVILLFCLAVTVESHAVRSRVPLSVVFALDVSDSMNGSDAGVTYITDTVQQHRWRPAGEADERQGLVVFGGVPAVELPPARKFPFDGVKSQVDRGATNLERALAMCAAMIGEDVQGRIVLVSDGVQTDGDLSGVLAELKSRRIAVDVLPVEYSYDNEVWLEGLDLPRQAGLGETFEAVVTLSALGNGRGKLVLRDKGDVVDERQVDYHAGRNRYPVPLPVRSTGHHEFTATIEVPQAQDGRPQNNTVVNEMFVEGLERVLLVTSAGSDRDGFRDWEPLKQAIQDSGRDVDVVDGHRLPNAPDSLEDYIAIVFCNVHRYEFDAQQLQAVRDAVVNHGVGFLMTGGPNSFGPGGYQDTVIEEILPVSMDDAAAKTRPKAALVIILNTNHFAEGNTWGKRLTKQAIKALGPQDEVGVISSTEKGETWLAGMTPAAKYEELVPVINGSQLGRVRSFDNTMGMGLKGLMNTNVTRRHMIIISDEKPAPPSLTLIRDFVDAKVTVTMVSVQPSGGLDTSMMGKVANDTGGRYYRTDDPSQLPAIVIKEAMLLRRGMLQDRVFTPTVGMSSPVIEGLGELPKLNGYVITTAKGAPALRILNGPPVSADSDAVDPILVVWQQGFGRTAAFTSDLGSNWGADWREWDRFPQFVDQLITDISRPAHLRLSAFVSGRDAVIEVEDLHPAESVLKIQATLSGPDQKSKTVVLGQVAPRSYRASVPMWGHGRYHVAAQGTGGDRRELATGAFGSFMTYTPEHLQFHSKRQVLQEIADRTGGRLLTGDPVRDAVYSQKRSFKQTSQASFDWFLIVLALLVPMDAALRRLRIDMSGVWRDAMHPTPVPATPTMVALLKTKQWVSSALCTKGTARLLVQIWSTAPRPTLPKQRAAAPAPSDVSASPDESAESLSSISSTTIEKLLVLKRRQDEQTPH